MNLFAIITPELVEMDKIAQLAKVHSSNAEPALSEADIKYGKSPLKVIQ